MAETHQALPEKDGTAEEEQRGHDQPADFSFGNLLAAGGAHGRQGVRGRDWIRPGVGSVGQVLQV